MAVEEEEFEGCEEKLLDWIGRVAGRANAAAGFMSSVGPDEPFFSSAESSFAACAILKLVFASPSTFLLAARAASAWYSVEKAGTDLVR